MRVLYDGLDEVAARRRPVRRQRGAGRPAGRAPARPPARGARRRASRPRIECQRLPVWAGVPRAGHRSARGGGAVPRMERAAGEPGRLLRRPGGWDARASRCGGSPAGRARSCAGRGDYWPRTATRPSASLSAVVGDPGFGRGRPARPRLRLPKGQKAWAVATRAAAAGGARAARWPPLPQMRVALRFPGAAPVPTMHQDAGPAVHGGFRVLPLGVRRGPRRPRARCSPRSTRRRFRAPSARKRSASSKILARTSTCSCARRPWSWASTSASSRPSTCATSRRRPRTMSSARAAQAARASPRW